MKIRTQLTLGALGIAVLAVANVGVIFLKSSEDDAKVINQSGVVRGATQRAIKLELSNSPNDELITKLSNLIDGLINGSKELGLPQATYPEYIAKMQAAQVQWELSQELIQQVRTQPTEASRAALLKESEKLFELTNAAVNAAEEYSAADVRQLKTIQLLVAFFNLIIVGAIVAGSRRITTTLNNFTSSIARSSDDIASKVERQEIVAKEQVGSVSQATSTVDQLGESSRRSAVQAEASATGASQVLALAEEGSQTVEQTMTGMENLKEKVRAIAEQIMNLSEQTGQIATVSQLVRDLANQTNMLALNAAVEAAHAGEQGKGFRVVASEIRKLADESRRSADQINNLVTDVQEAIGSAVIVTDEGKKTAESSIELAQETARSLIGVKDAVNSVFSNTSQISDAAKLQAVGIQEILATVNALNLGAMDTAADMGEVKASTVQLKQSANELRTMV
ncbi:MAG: methyl-accepting chemotaxis protein [Pleurocapsa sp.]